MSLNCCCVFGCTSSYTKNKRKDEKRHLFQAKTKIIAQQWREVIPNGDKLKEKFSVCDLHFDVSDVITEDVIQLPDGKEFRSLRTRPKLRPNAVPKHFSDIKIDKRKTTETFLPQPFIPVPIDQNFGKEMEFENIFEKAANIPLPSEYWFLTLCKNCIVINKWDESMKCSSLRVVINKIKKVNIYFGEIEVKFPEVDYIENVNDIVFLLKELDKLKPCEKCDKPRAQTCNGFVLTKEKGTRGIQSKYCTPCKKLWQLMRGRKSEKNKKQKPDN